MRIKGAFTVRWAPQDGKAGTGVTIQQTITRYAKSTSGTSHPTSGWQSTVPAVDNGLYLWTWVYVRYSDGTETNAYSVARMGIDGKGIQSSTVTYSQQATSVDPATITNWGAFPSTLTDGYWLYTKTHIVYSDGAATDSYSVSQVGVGAYYAGCQEYWAIGDSATTPPEGAPTPGTYVNGQTITTSWSQQRQQTTNEQPYLWNFEISADSRGNRYVTQAICIGNFAKGIASIVESYAISAYGKPDGDRSYPSDIAAADWTDEQHAAAPTEAKRYQWNRTVITYNDNSSDTHYHVSAVKGIDGKGATYIDLDNENDSMLYDGAGNLVSGSVSTNIYLYSNGQRVTSGLPAFTIKEKSSFLTAAIPSGSSTLTVSAFSGNTYSGYVIVQCTYNNVPYTARFTVKKLVGVDKYELELDHTAVSFNETKETLSTASVKVKVWRTGQNGTRTQLGVSTATALSVYGLTLWMYPNGVSADKGQLTINQTTGVATVNLTAQFAKEHTNFAVVLLKSNAEIDRETVPFDKVEDGDVGPGGVVLDLDNENDSMLYDGTGSTLISGNVTSQAHLLVGGEDKTDDVTEWDCVDKVGCTADIDNSGLVTVTAMSAVSGSCKARAKYNGEYYYAKLTLKKLVGVDKYEIICTPNALTYNTTKGTGASQNVVVKVYRTAQNGTRSLVEKLSDYALKLRYYYTNGSTEYGPNSITDGTGSGQYNSGATRSLSASAYVQYRFELLDANNQMLDAETVPISKTTDGSKGSDSVVLDLDNENDSILYDSDDTPISAVVESYGSLYSGPTKVTSGITWSIVSADCSGVTVMNGGDATSSSYSRSSYPTAAWITSGGYLRVNGLSASQGQVKVMATYNGKPYTKILTLKKLRGLDKFDAVISPAALTYNSSTGLVNGKSTETVTVEIWRTSQSGERTRISDYNGSNVFGLSLTVTANAGSTITPTPQSYGCTFTVNGTIANVNNSISVLLKKGTMTHDSETVPIAKTSNGSGAPGPASKSIYKNSFDQPATPTGSSPQGSGRMDWRDDAYTQDDVQVQLQGDFYKGADDYWYAPAIGASQETTEICMFVTTAANQRVYLRAKCSTSSYARLYIGNLDAVAPKSNYLRSISGSNQDTQDIEITVPTAGTHFISIVYVRGYTNSSSDLYAKFIIGKMYTWQSNAKTYNSAGAITAWSTPFKVSGEGISSIVQTRANILQQTAFVSSRMDKWVVKNGATTNGMDGRSAYKGVPDLTQDYKELLGQDVSVPNGDKPLLANTWYTLSFWAKAAPYVQLNKYVTSNQYGFATETCYLQAGVECELTINGYCSTAARNAGKELRVFVYLEDWGWSTSVAITATSSTSKSVKFTPPSTGLYKITSYAYSSGASSDQTVTINWYRINRGMRLVTYLYPTTGTQSTYTCIDTTAGRIKDGQLIAGSSPTDNNAEWLLTEVWTRHTLTFKTNSLSSTVLSAIQRVLFRMHQASNDVWVCMPKLEQGTQATAYCTNDNDAADMAADQTGFPNDCGVFVEAPETPYEWNDSRRDYVAYEVSGEWKRFFVRQKGMTVPNGYAPSAGGNTYWEQGSNISTLLTNTFIGTNCNIGGFLASNSVFKSANEKLILNGVLGIIQMFHDEGYTWQVLEDGRQVLGEYTSDTDCGQHIELDPCAREIRIYNESGTPVTNINGQTISSLSALFGDTSGSVSLNSNKQGSSSASNGGSVVIDNTMSGTRTLGTFDTNNACRVSVNGTLTAVGSQYTHNGSSDKMQPGVDNYARICLYLRTYSDSARTITKTNKLVAVVSSLDSQSGYGSKSITMNGTSVDVPAGYHSVIIEYYGCVFRNCVAVRSVSASWNITSVPYVSDIYLSRLFANGVAYGSSLNNFFAAMNTNGRMLVKAVTLSGSGTNSKQNGFELSADGLSVVHAGSLLRPIVTLGFGRITCSHNGSTYTDTLATFANGVRGSSGTPTVRRIGEGIHRVLFPSDWTNLGLVSSGIIASANGYYDSSNHNTTVTIQQITSTYVQFVVGDDMSPNDDYGFWFEIKYMLP